MSGQAGLNGSVLLPEEFSVCDCDRYAEHLAEISVRRRMVVATDEVRNQFGVLLLRRGAPLGRFAFGKMRGHRLNRPVDEALGVRDPLDATTLAARFEALLDSEPDLALVAGRSGARLQPRALCEAAALAPTLLQKLSVLEEVLPAVFRRALFTAWFGALLASERDLPTGEILLVFQAGLLHDLGLLHLEPALVDKQSGITREEWSAIQRHVLIGAIIADSLAGAPARLARIILHHHERVDGSGYPTGRRNGEIDPLARIVTLGDMLHALRFDSPFLGGGTLADCIPWLRVNRDAIGEDNYVVAGRILQDARATTAASAVRLLPPQLLLDTNRSLVTLRQSLVSARALLEALSAAHDVGVLQQLIAQLGRVSDASGLGHERFAAFFDQSIGSDAGEAGLREIQVTAQELLWLVRRIDRQLQTLARATRGTASYVAVRDLALGVQFELRRAWRRFDGVTASRPR